MHTLLAVAVLLTLCRHSLLHVLPALSFTTIACACKSTQPGSVLTGPTGTGHASAEAWHSVAGRCRVSLCTWHLCMMAAVAMITQASTHRLRGDEEVLRS